jgi:hypothetical protein
LVFRVTGVGGAGGGMLLSFRGPNVNIEANVNMAMNIVMVDMCALLEFFCLCAGR